MELYLAHLADLDPQWHVNGNIMTTRENVDAALGAAESDARRLGRLRDVLSDEAAATRYREELDKTGRFTTADIDRALAAAERGREARRQAEAARRQRRAAAERRVSRLERLLSAPGGGEALIAALDEQAPTWRRTGTRPNAIDRALDGAERGGPCHGPAGGALPTSGDPARWGAQRGSGRAGTIDPSCDPDPCPSPRPPLPAAFAQVAG